MIAKYEWKNAHGVAEEIVAMARSLCIYYELHTEHMQPKFKAAIDALRALLEDYPQKDDKEKWTEQVDAEFQKAINGDYGKEIKAEIEQQKALRVTQGKVQ